ncbi:hypothetical protein C7379_10619 [Hallella colorans]|uniref:Uncharacterized protein n=1 Tax=Hallella colorans TaxID=1703337 RepID=A0A2U0UFP6_9BACT|nr:hypothetical protein C7379_10619 [Hallella colorans]
MHNSQCIIISIRTVIMHLDKNAIGRRNHNNKVVCRTLCWQLRLVSTKIL